MFISSVALALALVSQDPATTTAPSVSGEWDVTITSPMGANTTRTTFKQDGDKLSGVLKGRQGELPFEGGTVTGNEVKWAFTVPFQGASLEITLTGKVDGSTMSGKANFGGMAEGDWTAKRVDPNAAPAASTTTTAPPAATATPTSLTGKWDVVVKTQMGEIPAVADITESDGKITGTIEGPAGAVELSGTLEGTTLKMSFTAVTPAGSMPISLTGEVTGDSISNGKAEFGAAGQAEWTAKRKP